MLRKFINQLRHIEYHVSALSDVEGERAYRERSVCKDSLSNGNALALAKASLDNARALIRRVEQQQ